MNKKIGNSNGQGVVSSADAKPMKFWMPNGGTADIAYDASILAFEHEGMTIRNPLLKDGAWCSATVYGFEATHTGGGCIAYRLDLPNGDQLLLTDEDGSALPDDPLDAVDAILGRYNEGGEPIAYVRVGDIPLAVAEAVDAIPAGEGPDEEQWIEFSHGDQRWSFSSCELAQWDDEDEAFHFNAFHGLSEPTVDAVKAFIDQV